MVCPFGFVAAGIVFGPRAFAKVRERPLYQQIAALAAVVLGGGYLLNRLLVLLPSSAK
jgi:hypothetical protein